MAEADNGELQPGQTLKIDQRGMGFRVNCDCSQELFLALPRPGEYTLEGGPAISMLQCPGVCIQHQQGPTFDHFSDRMIVGGLLAGRCQIRISDRGLTSEANDKWSGETMKSEQERLPLAAQSLFDGTISQCEILGSELLSKMNINMPSSCFNPPNLVYLDVCRNKVRSLPYYVTLLM